MRAIDQLLRTWGRGALRLPGDGKIFGGFSFPEDAGGAYEAAVKLKIQNVADFCWRPQLTATSAAEMPYINWPVDFGSLLPPWKLMTCEWNYPNFQWDAGRHRVFRAAPSLELAFLARRDLDQNSHEVYGLLFDVGIAARRGFRYRTDKYGRPQDGCRVWDYFVEEGELGDPTAPDEDISDHFDLNGVPEHSPMFLALTLSNCKNLIVYEVPVSERRQRRDRNQGRPIADKYYVLEIDRVLNRSGLPTERQAPEDSEDEMLRRLHICKGHLKHFTEQAPLFGRHAGDFWWSDHVRGDTRKGQVFKDYEVKALGGSV